MSDAPATIATRVIARGHRFKPRLSIFSAHLASIGAASGLARSVERPKVDAPTADHAAIGVRKRVSHASIRTGRNNLQRRLRRRRCHRRRQRQPLTPETSPNQKCLHHWRTLKVARRNPQSSQMSCNGRWGRAERVVLDMCTYPATGFTPSVFLRTRSYFVPWLKSILGAPTICDVSASFTSRASCSL